jgi:hypothetical protein
VVHHCDSDTYYVSAAADVDYARTQEVAHLQLRRHECQPLQDAFDLDERIEVRVLEAPTLEEARLVEATQKHWYAQHHQLINDGSHHPAALFSYH